MLKVCEVGPPEVVNASVPVQVPARLAGAGDGVVGGADVELLQVTPARTMSSA